MDVTAKQAWAARAPFLVLPLGVMLLHLLCINNYGYFRDELYYLACTRHIDWGYVDHPPLSIFLLKLVTMAFGDSLAAIRIPVVVGSGLTVFLVMATARKLGGTGWGLWLAGLCPALSGMYLVIYSFTTMNALDITLSALLVYMFVDLLESESLGKWSILGVVLGAAFLTKASVLWLVAGLGVGLLVSSHRRLLVRPGPWVSLAILAVMAAPHLWWQASHGWPTAEFATNARNLKLVPISPWSFLAQQAVVMNVVALPVIVAGIVFGFKPSNRAWLPLSVAFLVVVAILLVNGRSRVNYLAPAYPLVLAPGAVAVSRWFDSRRWKPAWALTALGLSAPFYMALGLPWLPPSAMKRLIAAIPIDPPLEERGPKSPMQGWADMFGWPELASAARTALDSLPPEERGRAAVVTFNYGEAAALQHFGVPRVISGHNTYWLWGPDGWDGRVAVFVHDWPSQTKEMFESFELVGRVDAPEAVPEQNGSPVWIARGLKVPLSVFWARMKRYF